MAGCECVMNESEFLLCIVDTGQFQLI